MRGRIRHRAMTLLVAGATAVGAAGCVTDGDVGSEPPVTAAPSGGIEPTIDPGLPDPETESTGTVTVTLQGADGPLVEAVVACSWSEGAVEAFIALGPVDIAGEAVYVDLAPSAPDPTDVFSLYRDEDAAYHAGPESGSVEVVERGDGDATGTVRFTDLGPDPSTVPPDGGSGDTLRPLGDDPAYATLTGIATWSCAPAP